MLLAIDVGNSIISVGLFSADKDLKFLASIDTDRRKTADQISLDLMNPITLTAYGEASEQLLKDLTPYIVA